MRPRTLLLVAVTISLVFAAAWLWRAAGDEAKPRHPVAAGQVGRVDTATYRLVSLEALERIKGDYDRLMVAEPDAVLVLARIDVDGSATDAFIPCTFELVAGELTWASEFGYFPPPPAQATCERGAAGTVAVVFEVPERFLDQVQGVAVPNPSGPAVLLLGRPA